MKYIKYVLLLVLLIPFNVYADNKCCADHGGLDYCVTEGYWVCKDGTESKTCACSGTYYPNKTSQVTSAAVLKNKEQHNTTAIIIAAVIAFIAGITISIVRVNLEHKKDKK